MDTIGEESVNVYLPDSYLKGVISFSETNAIGSCLLGKPYLKNDNTSKVAIETPVVEHVRLKKAYLSLKLKDHYRVVEPIAMQSEIMHNGIGNNRTQLRKTIDRAKEASNLKMEMVCQWLKLKRTKDDQSVLRLINTDHIPEWVGCWYSEWSAMNSLILEYRREEVTQTGYILKKVMGNILILVSSFGCILISKKSKRTTYTTYNQLLAWKDMALSRFNANMCIWISSCLNEGQEGLGLRSTLQGALMNKLYRDVDELLSLNLNEGFLLIKEFEGFIMSEILRLTEHAQFSVRFRNTLLNGLTDQASTLKTKYLKRVSGTVFEGAIYPHSESTLSRLGNTLRTIKLLTKSDINNAAELYFIFRIFGHPMVEEREAMDAVRLNNEVTKILELRKLAELRGAFVFRVIKGFVDNFKRWPKVKKVAVMSKRWRMYHTARTYPSRLELCTNDFLELAAIQFEQEFKVPERTNLEMVLNDKAISPPKRLIWSVYPKNYLPFEIRQAHQDEVYRSSDKDKTRRVLEYYLRDEKFDQLQLKQYIINQRYINDKDHVVSLTGKERELSVGRMFAMQPGAHRQVQILAEKLLSDNLVPFFPETLTRYGDLELQRIMELKSELSSVKTRRNDSYNNYIARASIVTDLSKFNQAFRYETTSVCGDIVDELHGTQSLFCWLHLTVPLTTIICTYRHAPPNTHGQHDLDLIPEQSGLYRYHMGGIEGWCQKLWTMEAISLLDVVSVKNRVQLTSLLNGDNQSIDVSKPVRLSKGQTEIQADYSLAVKMLGEIRDAYRGIGHKLKEGETYISRDLQFMSKVIQSEGVMYPSAIKKILRVGPWINTILDDIKTSAESIGSLCQELEFRGESFVVSVMLRNFWLYHQWMVESKQHPLAGQQLYKRLGKTLKTLKSFFNIESDVNTVNLWLNIPMHFGGGDPVVMYRSFYRRTPDFLTEAISHMWLLLNSVNFIDAKAKWNFFRAMLTIEKNRNATMTTLMRDPQAIGSERQAKVTSEINRTAVTSVLSISPNQLFSDSALHYSQNEEEIGKIVEDITPVYPHGLRVIYESLPFHKAEKVVNMISGTKSITNILQKTSAINGEDIERAVNMMLENMGLLERLLEKFDATIDLPVTDCQSLLCCKVSSLLREKSWDGIEIIGVSSPSMMTCMEVVYSSSTVLEGITIEKFSTDRTTRGHRGPKSPWVGSCTQEKKLTPVYNRQVLSKQQKEQLETVGKLRWVFKGVKGLRRTLNQICVGTLGINYKTIKPLLPRFMSVNFLHRLSVSSRPMEFPASIPAYRTTNYHFDTSPINKRLSERFGNEDINLVFQNAISCGVSATSIVEQLTGRSPRQITLVPVVEDIDIVPPPTFQGSLNFKVIQKITSDQHIFNPDVLDNLTVGKMLLPTVSHVASISNNYVKECFFNGYNLVETLSASLACHWCMILMELSIENNIFQKEWGDGFVTDHAFMDFSIFLGVFKSKLICHWGSKGEDVQTTHGQELILEKLLRVDNCYWKMMGKVFLESKVRKRLMILDSKILSVVGYISFKNWFVSSLRNAELHEVPWIVNADGDLVELSSVKVYLKILLNTSTVRTIMLSYSDMAHAITRLLRCKSMQDDLPTLTKILSPSDISPVLDPTSTLGFFPKIVAERLKTYDTSPGNTKSKLTKNYMTMLPWQHVNRYNFVFSSTGCKISLKRCVAKVVQELEPKILYFIGEGAGNFMARTACEYPNVKFVYRSLKDENDHHHPIEYQRVMGNMGRIVDSGEGLSMESTDATQKAHWDLIHRLCKDPMLITICDAEFKDWDDFFKMVIQWRRHVLSCKICTSYGTSLYLFTKYHARDVSVKLPHFVRTLATYVVQGSKISGSECYVLLGLGHQNSLPSYGEVRNAKLKIAISSEFQLPLKLDKSAVEANAKSLVPGIKIPITPLELNKQKSALMSKGPVSGISLVGGSKVIESKWINRKVLTVIDWMEHVLKLPKGDLNYDFFEALENTYPQMVSLVDNLNQAELKKLIKVTGYILSNKL
ncbi:RNA-dependent RNA polymerase [Gull metapneumovirus]|nr:RNA-dependent RNA polymerase [Gull metapneumovirus]